MIHPSHAIVVMIVRMNAPEIYKYCMRIQEILLEYKLNTQHYGYWIDPERKPHAVGFEGHLDYMSDVFPRVKQGLYLKAYTLGWVRLVTGEYELSIKGTKEAIKRNWSRIASNINGRDNDINKVAIDIMDPETGSITPIRSDYFRLNDPGARAKLNQFINT